MNRTLIAAVMAITWLSCTQAQESDVPATSDQVVVEHDLDPINFEERMILGDAILIDVRTPAEYASGHLDGAVNLDWNSTGPAELFAGLEQGTPVLVYCAAGGRSTKAMNYLNEHGFEAQQLANGIAAWRAAGLPVVED